MDRKLYQVDAFASRVFKGNPAAVMPLKEWLTDKLLQEIAEENNLSETAFFVKEGEKYRIRYFTPEFEVPLCGHATLASAHVIFNELKIIKDTITFVTEDGTEMTAENQGDWIKLNFPAFPPEKIQIPENVTTAFGKTPKEAYRGNYSMYVFDKQKDIEDLELNYDLLKDYDPIGVIATAPGDDKDFVSRFFAPAAGIQEDPVTGSSFCTLIPFWATVFGKTSMEATQISKRGGEVKCEMLPGGRISISGQAVTFLEGEVNLPEEQLLDKAGNL